MVEKSDREGNAYLVLGVLYGDDDGVLVLVASEAFNISGFQALCGLTQRLFDVQSFNNIPLCFYTKIFQS